MFGPFPFISPGKSRPHPRIENGEDPSKIITELENIIITLEEKILELVKENEK